MPTTTFITGTPISTPWLNEVNGLVWTLFNGASTPAAGRTALGATVVGSGIFTAVDQAAGRTALGATVTGSALFTAATAAAARTTLGSTTTGDALFIAATAAAARTTLGATTVGNAVFTAADETAARTAIGATIVNKNRFANGAFVFDQRNNGSGITVNSAAEFRCQDCCVAAGQAADGQFAVNQGSSSGLAGSPNFVRLTVTAADSSIGATQAYQYFAVLEGLDVADMGFGTAQARSVSIGFWFRSSITGTFSGSLRNTDNTRSYPYSWTYSTANVWQFIPIANIPGDTTGTWASTNVRGWFVVFNLGAGSSLLGTANAWFGSYLIGTTGSTNLIATNGATYDIALLQVEAGAACTSFEWVPYQAGLARVERYLVAFQASNTSDALGSGQAFSTTSGFIYVHHAQMRVKPSGILCNPAEWILLNSAGAAAGACSSLTVNQSSPKVTLLQGVVPSGLVAGNATGMVANATTARILLTGAEL